MVEFAGRRVAVTGAAGTVGQELVRQLIAGKAKEIRALDHSETSLFALESGFNNPILRCLLADIQNLHHLQRFFEDVDFVFHVAAYKHVSLCEMHPRAAVETNIIGVQNVITAAKDANVSRVLFTSSDKAVNPTNVMGTSKLMGERLMTAANALGGGQTIFASTRFGNVAGSSGSVIKIFAEQIGAGRPISLTDPEMTRFMMTLEESVRLVIDSMFLAVGGEVFVTNMPVVRIADLAEVMISELAPKYGRDPKSIEVRITGARPGEKLYEELTTEEEIKRTIEVDERFIVLPAWRGIYQSIDFSKHERSGRPADRVYTSHKEKPLTKKQVARFLSDSGLLG
jgi:FlaA1/EpsC-like NDP-sugar epimerase